ncbi:MAG: alcohol dehydrogenase catalytic domain-containing protein [Chitinophagaceae bacterium]|nr:alcohol dehydrogenase catalytic domain-containing protein [Chitinophagaceae bacterium]
MGSHPIILGHEYVGEIVRLPKKHRNRFLGNTLGVGDRVIFYIVNYCNNCSYCKRNLQQKCVNQKKFGHSSIDEKPFGGFMDYLLVPCEVPIYKIPSIIGNSLAASLTCPFSTALESIKKVTHFEGKNILVVGSGLLAVYTVIILKILYSAKVTVVITKNERLHLFSEIGADEILPRDLINFQSLVYDCIIDTVGDSSIINLMIDNSPAFSDIILIGATHPSPDLVLKPETIVRKCISIFGIHNYSPQTLSEAIILMEKNYKFFKILEKYFEVFPFSQIENAFKRAILISH